MGAALQLFGLFSKIKLISVKLKRILISSLVWIVLAVSLFVIFIPFAILWIFTFPFDRQHYLTQKYTKYWCVFYVFIYPFWDVKVIDEYKLQKGKACIAISNHQSMLDIMVLFNTYAYFIWVSKVENFRAPILGWVMTMNRYISLDRNDPRTFPKMFEDISRALKKNKTIMLFPEGTRSLTTNLGRFKDGAFKAAIDNKVPIIPIVLDGTGKVLPKEGMVIKGKARIIVKVLDEIPYEKFPSYEPRILKEYVKAIMDQELQKIRNNNL
jgi:1-acyl-sn-glycerol-3-phosphate acyltransferase